MFFLAEFLSDFPFKKFQFVLAVVSGNCSKRIVQLSWLSLCTVCGPWTGQPLDRTLSIHHAIF